MSDAELVRLANVWIDRRGEYDSAVREAGAAAERERQAETAMTMATKALAELVRATASELPVTQAIRTRRGLVIVERGLVYRMPLVEEV